MGTTNQNIQAKAQRLVELANVLEQSSQNQRWEEVAVLCKDAIEEVLATASLLWDIDQNLAAPIVKAAEIRILSLAQRLECSVESQQEKPSKKAK